MGYCDRKLWSPVVQIMHDGVENGVFDETVRVLAIIRMSFPDVSYARTVGEWRYIQSLHEPVERKNPDSLVGVLLPLRERYAARWLSRKRIKALRSHLFYYYLVARTKYYDQVFLDAMDPWASAVRSSISRAGARLAANAPVI